MALNKKGMDLKAIRRDQKAIDKLPNHGRASVNHAKSKALEGAKTHVGAMGIEHKSGKENNKGHGYGYRKDNNGKREKFYIQ